MKYYKLKFALIAIILNCFNVSAQNTANNDKGNLSLAVWVSDQIEGMPITAQKSLENKLTQIITANGISSNEPNNRFIITANVTVSTKDITSTAPPMHAYTLDVTFYIGDGIEGKSFASYTITIKGVGENETKAYMAALKNIKTNDPAYQTFIDKGKTKIIEYFTQQCDRIIKEANVAASMNNFDEAIWKLTSIPNVCSECWNKAMAAVVPIYQKKIDYECKAKLNEANNIWNSNQSWDGAEQAGAILNSIDPNASCFKDAKILGDKISKRIQAVDKREWSMKYDKEVGLEKDRIKAYRDVGVAYGNGQPKNVTYKSLW
jgi:hypothetical protein